MVAMGTTVNIPTSYSQYSKFHFKLKKQSTSIKTIFLKATEEILMACLNITSKHTEDK